MPDDLNEILKECAKLRGVFHLQHRILKEFEWFVNAIIFEEWNLPERLEQEEFQELRIYEGRSNDFKDRDNVLVEWGKLFLEYYREKADKWKTEDYI